ncbi:excalibur calcium-binding domain-containing protein [Actinomycetes bacterium KLBMP 9797]
MSQPPLDEPWQEPRAVRYGRANQAASHYRPRAGQGRVTPSRSQATRKPPRKSTNHRRFWLFAIALLVALAAGAAMFTAVLAGPKPMAQPPDTPGPAPTQPTGPAQPPATGDQPRRAEGSSTSATTGSTDSDPDEGTETQTAEPPPGQAPATTPPASGDGGGGTASPPASDYGYYKNCGQARKAGVAPLHTDDPGYSAELDKDGDGVACETGTD